MKLLDRFAIGLAVFFGLFVTHQLVAKFVSIHKWPQLGASDWGTWVGSIGTVATLGITIWLATDASRARRNEQLNLALVTTAAFNVRLRNIVRALENARTTLENPLDQPEDTRVMFADNSQRIDDHDLWTAEELVPLVCLPNQLAARLAWIGTNVRSTKAFLKKIGDQAEEPAGDVVEALARNLVYDLNESVTEIQRVMVEFANFQLEHGFEHAIPRYNPAYEARSN
jgi:hypothetical protein